MPTCNACNTTDPEIYVGFSKTECTNRKCVCFVEHNDPKEDKQYCLLGYIATQGTTEDREEAVKRYFVDTVHNVRFLDDEQDEAQQWVDFAKHVKRGNKQ